MNFWPLTVFRTSPYMPSIFEMELRELPKSGYLSPMAHSACLEVANRTAPVEIEHMTITLNVGGAANQIFMDYPDPEQWLRLERAGMVQDWNGMVFMMVSNLH